MKKLATMLFVLVIMANKAHAQKEETITYYTYCNVNDGASKTTYYTNIFSFKVDNYRSGDWASIATGKLESQFNSYIYRQTGSRYLTKVAIYFSTYTEALEHRDSKMNVDKSSGKNPSIFNLPPNLNQRS
ncbi:hypothetical protein [Emticicia sp. 21SJ11W-3]|uniref:hypothetical protein n=1 Tax=Emticicia sp. 21SJ11W-3 TaxID=2916755 RepID=UPI00209D3626|nr:hypothetical protein [Emticicia sp. 21SJ11W-3]UTA67393.1 hypothetical protein MB380_17595 [Emticicia sp. 21SJ11W-3]